MMGSVCPDQHHHKFHHSHPLHHLTKNPSPLREIDIPPRKLFPRRNSSPSAAEIFAMDSLSAAESDAFFSRFLPCNNPHSSDEDSDNDDPYSSDNFRIYEFKIRKCHRSRSHDWTDCPFAHPGEKARRRDPRRFPYSGTVCPDFRKGGCRRGDSCEFSHGVFECWLHPARYRTEACKDGKKCRRKICFFAHSAKQLRILPENPPSPTMGERKAYCHNSSNNELNFNRSNCCVFCRSITASPTSTLMSMSPPASPMFSQEMSPMSPFDRRRAGLHEYVNASGMSYEEAMTELMASYDAMTVAADAGPPMPSTPVRVGPPMPSTPVRVGPPMPSTPARAGQSQLYRGGFSGGRNLMEDDRYNNGGGSSSGGPDLGWVNDLLT